MKQATPSDIVVKFTIIWENSKENNNEIRRLYGDFLIDKIEDYVTKIVWSIRTGITFTFRGRFDNLEQFIEMLSSMLEYLIENGISWKIDTIYFNFKDIPISGSIDANSTKFIIINLTWKDGESTIQNIPIGKLIKL